MSSVQAVTDMVPPRDGCVTIISIPERPANAHKRKPKPAAKVAKSA